MKTKRGSDIIKREKGFVLDIEEEKPTIFKPSGFYETLLIEPTYLVFRNIETDEKTVRPSLIIVYREKFEVYDFMSPLPVDVRGVFPREDLATLITINGVRNFMNSEVDAKTVLYVLENAIKTHVMISHNPAYPTLLKYWILGTFFYDVFDAYPIFGIIGPSESGKSRILSLILCLSYHGDGILDPTEAGMFRTKEEEKPTLCFDEAEYLTSGFGSRSIVPTLINASYSKISGMAVTRTEEIDGRRIRKRFELYSPMAISCISGFTGVTASRMITLITRRVEKDYPIARISDYNQLRDNLYILRFQYAFKIKEAYDKLEISSIVSARFNELFKPLFTLIKVFGTEEEWNVMAEYAKQYQEDSRSEALNVSDEEEVLITLWSMEPEEGEWYSVKELTDKLNLQYSRDLRTQRVSAVLKRLGFTKRRHTSKGRVFEASKDQVVQIADSLGIGLRKQEEKNKPQERNWQ
jgi:hypothetical protein